MDTRITGFSQRSLHEKMCQKNKVGLGHTKFTTIQYERMQAILEAKRLSSQLSQQKVQKVLDAAQMNKEKILLRLQRQVWLQEHHRLTIARHKTENDLQCFLHEVECKEDTDTEIFSQLLEYELNLQQDCKQFWRTTVEPLYQLRNYLKYRMTSHCSIDNTNTKLEDILQQILSHKQQQGMVMDRLQCECVSLQQDICITKLKEYLQSAAMGDHTEYLEKVPEEIFTADCPYPDLRSDLIHSFHSLTQKYKLRLVIAENRLQGLDRNCGWNTADHECIKHIMSQYSQSMRNQRSLYIDMAQRVLPHKTLQELREHERQSDWYYFSMTQRGLILQGWQRDHSELLLRSLSMLEDARIYHKQQQDLQNQRSQQQNICHNLKKKVQHWRIQQEEAAELEAALAAYWHNEEEERLRKEQQREKTRRVQLTQQINKFHAEKQRRREAQRKHDMERLAELRRKIEEQLQRDKERVIFRTELLQQKRQMREAKEKQKQKDSKEREERLQALCNQVRKVAEANPQRLMGNTVAWRARHHPEEEFALQRPLYQLNTYTDEQIVSDPRVRIEQALRNEGLHNTPYARKILSEIHPPKPPRRDMESTTFRS